MTRIPGAGRAVGTLCLVLAMFGCADPPAPVVPVAAPVTAFDGRWSGTMQLTGAASSVPQDSCNVPPRFNVDVRNGQFTLAQVHPLVGSTSPSLRGVSSLDYTATISADGSFTGVADSTGATLSGRIADGRMSGNIYGLLCYYSFSATRG